MACLNLSNGDFGIQAFTPANHNAGLISITRLANSIEVAHANFVAPLVLSGGPNRIYHSAVFGGNSFVAVLEHDESGGIVTRKVYIVDFKGNGAAPAATVVHTQSLVQSSTPAPQLSASAGSESLVFVFSATTTQRERPAAGRTGGRRRLRRPLRPDLRRRQLWLHWVGKELREPKEPDRSGDGPERKRPKPKPKPKPKGTGSSGPPASERPLRKR